MPYFKISTPPEHANKNTASCGDLIEYLEKENIGKDLDDQEHFFSHEEDMIFSDEAQRQIDNNVKGLKKTETKFYELSLSYSQDELQHITNIASSNVEKRALIQKHVRDVMDHYAKHFNRSLGERPLNGKDLVYFAKIENQRRYHPDTKNPELKKIFKHNYQTKSKIKIAKENGKQNLQKELEKQLIKNKDGRVIEPGQLKDGHNTHVHIVVSRKDRSQTISLSPLANSRGSQNKLNGKEVKIGFNRDTFAEKVEHSFDHNLGYDRAFSNKYRNLQQAKSMNMHISKFKELVRSPEQSLQIYATKLIQRVIANQLVNNNKTTRVPTIKNQNEKLRKIATKKNIQKTSQYLVKSGAIKAVGSAAPPLGIIMNALKMVASKAKQKSQELVKDSNGHER